jgi:CHASE3 domain sensor protein
MSNEPGDDEEAKILAQLKEWGEDKVRRLLASNQLSLTHHEPALRWIEEIDRASAEEAEWRKDAFQEEQTEIARSAKDAAWAAARAAERANIRATIALVIASISIVITIIGFWIK